MHKIHNGLQNGLKFFIDQVSKNLSLKTTQHYLGRVELSTGSNTTRLHKAQHIQVPYVESNDTEEEEEKLSPLSVVELHKLLSFLARSKFIYIFS